jgi:hypothetical protein
MYVRGWMAIFENGKTGGGLARVLGHGQENAFGDHLQEGWGVVDQVGWMVF